MHEIWNAVQACLWSATQDEARVARLRETHTFIELAMETELAGDDVADSEASPPPGWIGHTQKELLGACAAGKIKLMGVPSTGGPSREIPGSACAVARFFCNHLDQGECLGPPGAPPGVYWTHLRVVADDVRRVWPAIASPSPQAIALAITLATARRSPAESELPAEDEQPKEPKGADHAAPAGNRPFGDDASADDASSPSIPATTTRSATSPTYAPSVRYSPDKVPDQFEQWARAQHDAGVIITQTLAWEAMRSILVPGVGLSRDNVREWTRTLPSDWVAKLGKPPSR
jgi:hypothetical protein